MVLRKGKGGHSKREKKSFLNYIKKYYKRIVKDILKLTEKNQDMMDGGKHNLRRIFKKNAKSSDEKM